MHKIICIGLRVMRSDRARRPQEMQTDSTGEGTSRWVLLEFKVALDTMAASPTLVGDGNVQISKGTRFCSTTSNGDESKWLIVDSWGGG